MVAVFSFFVFPAVPAVSFLSIPREAGKKLFFRFFVLVIFFLLGYFGLILFREKQTFIPFLEVTRTIYITWISLLVVWLSWGLIAFLSLNKKHPLLSNSLKILLVILLCAMITIEWLGYHLLALYIISGFFFTALTTIFLWVCFRSVNWISIAINRNKIRSAQGIKYYLGLKPHKNIYQLAILKLAADVLLLYVGIYFLLKIWGARVTLLDQFEKVFVDGFYLAGFKVSGSRFLFALIIFSILDLIGRSIAAYVTRKHQFEREQEAQDAVASIIKYISFTIALLVGLLFAGVNFTGLAIIAGALSVGIGLGLQSIVNNFVSGIILLLEKSIKVGDRIVIGDTEGFVQKIRIRATQIRTMLREDVIVPNSDLVTKPVVNYMFKDPYWRVNCKVGVSYESDVDLVTKVLMEVALKHPDVIQDPPNEPTVLFRSFGESTLDFELWVIISDVNNKYVVQSDLNFSINKAFKEHNIAIAFPQRDIHIRAC